ncbi:MAG TPA: trypsin-like peptidase domain-containing protein [Actinomycetota bacterium]|nr:trypsin-like peptidase domain-containing protein [Actinomycetota bacterium]
MRIASRRTSSLSVGLTALACIAGLAGGATAKTAPVGNSPCPGVRPGAHVTTSAESGGTLNFVFKGSDGKRYVGTAGHLLADEETRTWKNDGPTATLDDGTVIGRAVYASNHNGAGDDFALIRLARGVPADPAMCHWGGPTGLHDEVSSDPTVLRLYGNGQGIGEAVPARTMLAATMIDETEVAAFGAVAPGDSGSPVISAAGRAVGVQFSLGVMWGDDAASDPAKANPGTVGIYRLGPQVDAAEAALGLNLELMTAPLAEV